MSEKSAILAGYVTGTNVFLACARRVKGLLSLTEHQNFANRDFSDFEAILNYYLKNIARKPTKACIGVAGPVIENKVRPTNIPWEIVGTKITEKFLLTDVKLINDLVATAHGLFELTPDKFYTINEGSRLQEGNIGLIASGAGLGETLIYTDGRDFHPFDSEGGHAGFAPGNQLESELWEYLYSESGEVAVEDIVSLSGLVAIARFLIDTNRSEAMPELEDADGAANSILELALSGKSETAVRTLDIFIDCYASEAANLALKGMTMGGVYLGGMIAPQIITALDKGRFMERFVRKGKMESLLTQMPVQLIIDDKTALLGAAKAGLES